MTAPIGAIGVQGWTALGQARLQVERSEDKALLQLAGLSFESAVTEALAVAADARAAGTAELLPTPPPAEDVTLPGAEAPGGNREASVIRREAERTGVDAALLSALRRTENGGVGREFGVLSVKAPDLDSQARVAANTVRNTIQRFEQGGGRAIDAQTGRYSDEFLRYFSARYAPIGAANDPSGLNRYHAANLIALYQKAGRSES